MILPLSKASSGIEARGERLRGREGRRAAVRSAGDVSHAQRTVIQLQRGNAEPRQRRDEAGSVSRSGRRRLSLEYANPSGP